jgi:hypothetical protein
VAWKILEGNRHELPPGGRQRYVAMCRLTDDDTANDGEIINAIAISGRTATGQHFYDEQDAIIDTGAQRYAIGR